MTYIYNFTYLLLFFKLIGLHTFLEFFSFVYVIFELSMLFYHIKYLQKLAPYYILFYFMIINNLKIVTIKII